VAKNKVSGWYVSDAGSTEKNQLVDEWYEKIAQHDYRGISVEAPSKMVLALGKLAQQEGVSFQNLIENILAEYLKNHDIDWQGKANT
jgi:hypothetical protein